MTKIDIAEDLKTIMALKQDTEGIVESLAALCLKVREPWHTERNKETLSLDRFSVVWRIRVQKSICMFLDGKKSHPTVTDNTE